ncbi:carboxylating.nicotinate-nucleotide diphosphorylase [Methanoplanus sp. FWC-SCC4]|uniref:Nicotinate-nucleotide pyrophosphorylase [carboxylating] n=1 Tax=Methanochimaera problematica TaxID=2609417 RepID=A0AA97FE38_9EURY|nr:carboxylating nicotinate-nucleotide diphosphorylase [Methanoplanus sp. FWC-SCC4]WOF17172.1 carboxylating.nicotinate-nucleotide diphosphorylase [Methanoplanus sp. FWC-SCC4]
MAMHEKLLSFLEEDISGGDITSEAVVPDVIASAVIVAKETGIIAGLKEAKILFEYFGLSVKIPVSDGSPVKQGDVVMEILGKAAAILTVERTALNIIGRMSGIATKTRKLSLAVSKQNPDVKIAGTRKTAPGLREFDKKAIILGGGDPHRYNLSDGYLIKDNHLMLCPLKEAIKKAREYTKYKKIEVEVESVKDAMTAADAGADIIMFDNMAPESISEALEELKGMGVRDFLTVEVSGGITEENILSYAGLGIDIISLGALTHSVRNFDVSLDMKPGLQKVKINI